MSLKYLHLLRPRESLLRGFECWMKESLEVMQANAKWDNCCIRETIFDEYGAFSAQSVADKIMSEMGPVVMVPNFQTSAALELARRIGTKTVIRTGPVGDSTCLWQLLEEAHDAFQAGDPQRPRSIAVAILLMNKLEKEHMWGGKNKGYKWVGDLPTGRGMPANCAGVVPNIIGQLFNKTVIIRKTSQGMYKYALNPAMKAEIYECLRSQSLDVFPELKRIFERDIQTLSARLLDLVNRSGCD